MIPLITQRQWVASFYGYISQLFPDKHMECLSGCNVAIFWSCPISCVIWDLYCFRDKGEAVKREELPRSEDRLRFNASFNYSSAPAGGFQLNELVINPLPVTLHCCMEM